MVRGASRCIRYVATTIDSFGAGIAGGKARRVRAFYPGGRG